LDNTRSADEYKAKNIIKGYEKIGCDAINIGGYELAGGVKFLQNIMDSTDIPFISANLRNKSTGKLFADPYVIVDREPFRVGVIGLTSLLKDGNKYIVMDDIYKSGKKYMKEVRKKADIVIMLVNADRKEKQILQDEFKGADYIVISRDISRTRQGQPQQKSVTPVYCPGKQGKYMAFMEMDITHIDSPYVDVSYYNKLIQNSERRIANYQKKNPDIPLKELYSDNQAVYRQIVTLEKQLVDAKDQIANARNKVDFELIPMSKKITDNPKMLSFVDGILAKDKQLRGSSFAPIIKKK
jgi:2',3'-cyclic-nucleotide 2'-phosphodiesterase (5'-nucleotidase family)|tara:strand:- start:6524 stop:7414 length:891 start_codon:yes stop_codon:yes gene_type:complete